MRPKKLKHLSTPPKAIQDILPHLKKYSAKLNNAKYYIGKPWRLVTPSLMDDKVVYIFRPKNDELIYSLNGVAAKGKWEYLFDAKKLLIELNSERKLYQMGFLSKDIFILQQHGNNQYLFLVNEIKLRNITEPELLDLLEEEYDARERLLFSKQKRSIRRFTLDLVTYGVSIGAIGVWLVLFKISPTLGYLGITIGSFLLMGSIIFYLTTSLIYAAK